jgi:6-phosphogluconolactonase
MTEERLNVSKEPHAEVAERFAALAEASESSISVAFSGGSTPAKLFALLASDYRERIPWRRVHVYQVDERAVPPDHERSNWRLLKKTLLDHVHVGMSHRMSAEKKSGAAEYETMLRRYLPERDGVPAFDLVLLGLGDDGHTASLFPGTDALDEKHRAVVRHYVPKFEAFRMTLTLPVLNAAANRWFLVTGAAKREALADALAEENPAGLVHEPEWFVDAEAAGQA